MSETKNQCACSCHRGILNHFSPYVIPSACCGCVPGWMSVRQKSDTEILLNRIEEIENRYISCSMLFQLRQEIEEWKRGYEVKLSILMKCNSELEEKLTVLENKMDIHDTSLKRKWQANTELSNRLTDVERALENYREYRTAIEDLETDVMYLKEGSNKKPHKCPVCEGKGYYFPGPLYKENCPSCEGTGIVWN